MATKTTENMTVTYRNIDVHNLAIGGTSWDIGVGAGRKLVKFLDETGQNRVGSYWNEHITRAFRRAVRAKRETFNVWTAGFATADLSNFLHNIDVEKTVKN